MIYKKIIIFLFILSLSSASANDLKVAPAFSLRDQTGNQLSLQGILKNTKNKIVLLSIFQTTCAPCIAEIQYLNEIKAKYNFELILIDSKEDRHTTFTFLQKNNFNNLTVLNDPNGKLDQLYQITSIPKLIFINAEGKIIMMKEGKELYELRKSNELESIIKKLSN